MVLTSVAPVLRRLHTNIMAVVARKVKNSSPTLKIVVIADT